MDEQLRQLERRFKQTGTVDDEAAWLAARRAAGHLTADDLEVLAHVGSPAAARVLGVEAGSPEPDLRGWLEAFETRGRDVVQRVAVSIARTTVARWRALVPDNDHPVRAVELARAVLEGTAVANAKALKSMKSRLEKAHQRVHAARVRGEAGACFFWEVGERLLDASILSPSEEADMRLMGVLRLTPGSGCPELLAAIPSAVRRDLEAWLSRSGPGATASTS
jgi:hypothetical protein